MRTVPRARYPLLPPPAPCAGKLVTLRGTVVRMTPVRPLVTHMDFVCAKCGAATRAAFDCGVYAPPTKCSGVFGGGAREVGVGRGKG